MSRKKLSDTEASFLTGSSSASPQGKQQLSDKPTTQPTKKPMPTQNQSDTMSQILSPAATEKEPSTRFTADLPDSLHERLSMAALKAKKSKVQLVREILDAMLPQ